MEEVNFGTYMKYFVALIRLLNLALASPRPFAFLLFTPLNRDDQMAVDSTSNHHNPYLINVVPKPPAVISIPDLSHLAEKS